MSNSLSNSQDMAAQTAEPIYRYVNSTTGVEFPHYQVFHEQAEVRRGDVVEIQAPDSKLEYFSVDSVEQGEPATVYLVKARNSLWKSLLILVILGVSWVVIDFVLKLIF